MNVQELIDRLLRIEDKTLLVFDSEDDVIGSISFNDVAVYLDKSD